MKEEQIYYDPPERILCLLRWFCAENFLEEIEGDLYELFQEEVELYGITKANRRFSGNAIRYIRPYFFGKKVISPNLKHHLTMFQHYFKIATRHLWKQRLYSLINISGLAIGLACCIAVLFYVKDELGFDNYHLNADNIYRVSISSTVLSSGGSQNLANSPILWGPALKRDYPEVEDYARFVKLVSESNPWKWRADDKIFKETNILYADPSTFDLFNWKVLHGDAATALVEKNGVVLTKDMAYKYFNTENAVGKTITLDPRQRDNDGNFRTETYDYTVRAVIENVPRQSHFTFDFLLPSAHLSDIYGLDINGSGEERNWFWRGTVGYTYLQLKEGTDPQSVEAKFDDFQDRYLGDATKSRGYVYHPFLQRINEIYLAGNMNAQLQPVGDKIYIYGFSLLALFILFIACINFTNLSTARAITRAKEVGLRKVVGAGRSQLVTQFLGESLIITLFALFFAIGLARYSLPLLYHYLDKNFAITLSDELPFFLVLLGIGGLVGVLAGSYPAFFLSKFKPVKVLKGTFTKTQSGTLVRKGLVVFQFLISAFLIIFTLTLHKQLNFMKTYDLGFDQDRVLVVPPNTARSFARNYEAIKAELLQAPAVEAITMSSAVPGQGGGGDLYAAKDADASSGFGLGECFADYNFIEIFGLELIAGRDFSKEIVSDQGIFEEGKPGQVTTILNESALRQLGWTAEEAIGKQIVRDPNAKDWIATVIGVVKDFHFESLTQEINPIAIILLEEYSFLSVKLKRDDLAGGIQAVEAKVKQFAPDVDFTYNFLDESFKEQYAYEQQLGQVLNFTSFLAILIACLGLFGLAAFMTAQRVKEIGIRKTLGASTANIVFLLSKDFTKLVLIAVIIAIPVGWYATNIGLMNFAYRIDNTYDVFVLSLILALLVAFLTVSFHTLKVALKNPAKTLKVE